jgi:radical SAM protein (TIGR04043 family)
MMDIHTILKKKTELLCKGVYLDKNLFKLYQSRGIEVNYGRKGGAGPCGGRYFIYEDTDTLVNVAMWDNLVQTNLSLKDWKDGFFDVYDEREKGLFGKIKIIENPKFYDLKTSEGIQMKQIALMHGVDCLSTTIYQKCKYWACGQACKFCGIELSLDQGSTILEKTAEQLIEVIDAAKKEGKCNHMTLTSGTTEEEDKGAKRYIEVLRGIKEVYPDLPIHIQIEPIDNLSYINELKEAGADTIGIHIEVIDEILRPIITPGKAHIPYELFEDNWKHAVELFGSNQVSSYILTGFGESPNDFIDDLDKIISIGVIPYITPVRAIPGKKSNMPIMNHNALLEIYSRAAKLMKEYGVDPLQNKAGCVRCGGCSAINEAYRIII